MAVVAADSNWQLFSSHRIILCVCVCACVLVSIYGSLYSFVQILAIPYIFNLIKFGHAFQMILLLIQNDDDTEVESSPICTMHYLLGLNCLARIHFSAIFKTFVVNCSMSMWHNKNWRKYRRMKSNSHRHKSAEWRGKKNNSKHTIDANQNNLI